MLTRDEMLKAAREYFGDRPEQSFSFAMCRRVWERRGSVLRADNDDDLVAAFAYVADGMSTPG